jgi:phosphoribosylformimino-5-aminoimidazole carboxamide ribotide isomerase
MVKRKHPNKPDRTAAFEIIPAIDLRDGRVVRLSQGDFNLETIYGDEPAEFGRSFEAAGARWLHIVDLDGARDGARRQTEAIGRIVAAVGGSVACEVAGGLRDEEAVAAVLEAGAARAVVGTAALSDPAFAERLIARFGAERIAIALDVRDGLAVGQGWVPGAKGVPAEETLATLADRGAGVFIVTAIERDGQMMGPDVDLLARMVALGRGEIIASAGVSSLGDIFRVRAIGCTGAIVGRALYEGRLDLAEAVRAAHGLSSSPS